MAVLSDEAAATARPAAGSSFYTAMRILPRPRREAIFAVYAFCRTVDDIADDPSPRAARMAALDAWRADIDGLFRGASAPDPLGLAGPIAGFGLDRGDFHAIIDGMAMDVAADIRAPDWATLDLYCERVASAVGRLAALIFGLNADTGRRLAHHLGRALQLTNILRDLDEDSDRDRLYLPREALSAAGIDPGASPAAILADPRLAAVCAEVAARAATHFDVAEAIMRAAPRRNVRAPRLMAAAYRDILAKLTARGWSPPRAPVRPSRLRLLAAVFRFGIV